MTEPNEETQDAPETHQPETHEPEGLDLARDLTRQAAARTGVPGRRRRRSPGGEARSGEARESRAAPAGELRRGQFSGPRPDERDPQTIDGEVAKLIDRRGWELQLRIRGVFARWPELVGDDVAGHSTPESFVDGVLKVRTDSTAWATQLRLLTPQVLRRLNAELGEGTVRVLEVAGPQGPSWSTGRRSVRGARGPRDTYG